MLTRLATAVHAARVTRLSRVSRHMLRGEAHSGRTMFHPPSQHQFSLCFSRERSSQYRTVRNTQVYDLLPIGSSKRGKHCSLATVNQARDPGPAHGPITALGRSPQATAHQLGTSLSFKAVHEGRGPVR